MVFSIEALRARHGDCLLLHYGTRQAPRLVLIDGGPARVYGDALKPRLAAIRDHFATLGRLDGECLVLDLIMVSHIDDDHIHGLLELVAELLSDDEAGRAPWLRPKALWHNSFAELTADEDGLLALGGDEDVQALSSAGETPTGLRQAAAVVASVDQGRRLRNETERLGWPINAPFDDLVQASSSGGQRVKLDEQTSLLVLAPRKEQVDRLRQEWQEQLRRLQQREAGQAEVAAYLDRSPYNLASIVCLAEQGNHRMLLTGDARGDHICEALEVGGLLDRRPFDVDVLKLPHHGSIRNIDTGFFAAIRADHYVISADGRHGNPETETLELIARSREDDDFAIHLTYADGVDDLGSRLTHFIDDKRQAGRRYEITSRRQSELALRVDLDDPLAF